ncbi:hypothetical protein HBB16_14030 [Pseudonocardia sp. MCCB 268]|nr:hypothetical protein [Pseudonocardia cytotoxica]
MKPFVPDELRRIRLRQAAARRAPTTCWCTARVSWTSTPDRVYVDGRRVALSHDRVRPAGRAGRPEQGGDVVTHDESSPAAPGRNRCLGEPGESTSTCAARSVRIGSDRPLNINWRLSRERRRTTSSSRSFSCGVDTVTRTPSPGQPHDHLPLTRCRANSSALARRQPDEVGLVWAPGSPGRAGRRHDPCRSRTTSARPARISRAVPRSPRPTRPS